jgi:hypothetical protein
VRARPLTWDPPAATTPNNWSHLSVQVPAAAAAPTQEVGQGRSADDPRADRGDHRVMPELSRAWTFERHFDGPDARRGNRIATRRWCGVGPRVQHDGVEHPRACWTQSTNCPSWLTAELDPTPSRVARCEHPSRCPPGWFVRKCIPAAGWRSGRAWPARLGGARKISSRFGAAARGFRVWDR